MAARAVASFQAQTYQNKELLIWDNGELNRDFSDDDDGQVKGITHIPAEAYRDIKIGQLRNEANGFLNTHDIIIHWDDDDVSHPLRIEEQVALLQSSGADVVGYSDMLFWRLCPQCKGFDDYCADVATCETCKRVGGEAWLYRNNDRRYCLGTSLCYWRKTWEAKPFHSHRPERRGATGEEFYWLQELRRSAVSSLGGAPVNAPTSVDRTKDLSLGPNMGYGIAPRMVASIHSSNTQDYRGIDKSPNSWTRVPAWDSYCRGVMAL